ncbi:MAG: DUF2804 family protein [Thermoleophilaceae bacterium]|nr:DUF2804 family protein [Thermoleophilaceae bacterium]
MGPARDAAVRDLVVALPEPGALVHEPVRPPEMKAWLGTRPLKRWRYVGAYGPEVMVCVGEAWIGRLPQRWWAVALPDGSLHGRTTLGRGGVSIGAGQVTVEARGFSIDLQLGLGATVEPVESVNPSGAHGYVWTRKQAGLVISGTVSMPGGRHRFEGEGAIDDTAGYHQRRTTWWWSAGVGRTREGTRVGWNLVSGVNDDREASERTLWINGVPKHLAPVSFAADLAGVAFEDGNALRFTEWAAREHNANLLLLSSAYRQPFGVFSGTLPGGLELESGYGVMEWHDARW